MRATIEIPDIAALPQTICRMCGRSLINGLFMPSELKRPEGPRCRRCIGEVSQVCRNKYRKPVGGGDL
jgi:hypothetical protein